MRVSIGQAAKEFGVSKETLRGWETAGKIEV
jgi:DNA-binding transcriptional MerR regulator